MGAAEHGDGDVHLTPRQRQVLELLAKGYTNPRIGEELGISLDGAKWHVGEVLAATGTSSREEAAAWWRRHQHPARRVTRWATLVTASAVVRWTVLGTAAAATAGVAILAAAIARAPGEETSTATPGSVAAVQSADPEPTESLPVVEGVPSFCEVGDCWPTPESERVDTIEELVAEADVIALVHVEQQTESAWLLAGGPPVSRFQVTAQEVFKGDPGESFVATVQGGTAARTGNPWTPEGFKPTPGEPTVEHRFAEAPMFQVGRRELVFFDTHEWPDGSLQLYPMAIGRYRIERVHLQPLFGARHRLFDELAPQPLRDQISGLTLDGFRGAVAPIVAAQGAAPPPPLTMASDIDLGRYREELAGTLPHVMRAIEAIESGDALAAAEFKSWQLVECSAPGQDSFVPQCADAGVSEGSVIEAEFVYDRLFASTGGWQERGTWTASLEEELSGSGPRLVAAIVPRMRATGCICSSTWPAERNELPGSHSGARPGTTHPLVPRAAHVPRRVCRGAAVPGPQRRDDDVSRAGPGAPGVTRPR